MSDIDDWDLPTAEELASWSEASAEYEKEFMRNAYNVAEREGCELIQSTKHTLQLDLDTDADYDYFKKQQEIYNRYADDGYSDIPMFTVVEEWRSRSGVGRHVILRTSAELSVQERIMWQALFGSDRTREILNLLREYKGVEDPIALFKPKE